MQISGFSHSFLAAMAAVFYPWCLSARAGELHASDGTPDDFFGFSVSVSGHVGVAGSSNDMVGGNYAQGSAYVFRQMNAGEGKATQSVKLAPSDGNAFAQFGGAVSVSGESVMVGSPFPYNSAYSAPGAAYVFRDTDSATGTITQNLKLRATDGTADDQFGRSVSLSGGIGLVGSNKGSVYLFRELGTATGGITENARLTTTENGLPGFGFSVSLSGTIGLVGAPESNAYYGSAYVFRGLDTATGTRTENVRLTASDGAAYAYLGRTVSLSGNIGLVGAETANAYRGAAYVFRDLDTAVGTVTENLKLTASDGQDGEQFGTSVSLSGANALVGAVRYLGFGTGSAYLFRNLDTATGTVSQNVKIMASQSGEQEQFAKSLSLDGDNFIIGALGGDGVAARTGKAISGTVSSLTTLDAGRTARVIDSISFVSKDNWIIGETTDSNHVTLTAGDSATVTAPGKGVYVGKNAGADGNILTIEGSLTASFVQAAGEGGRLEVNGAVITTGGVILRDGAALSGIGKITGAVVLESGGTISPGNSAGVLVTGSQTWNGGGAYLWQVSAAAGAAGSDWDLIRSTGSLSIAADSADPFYIRIDGRVTGLAGLAERDWTILTADGGIEGFSPDKFALDASGFSSDARGDFSLLASGNQLVLRFMAVPEPGAGVLLLTGLMLAFRRESSFLGGRRISTDHKA